MCANTHKDLYLPSLPYCLSIVELHFQLEYTSQGNAACSTPLNDSEANQGLQSCHEKTFLPRIRWKLSVLDWIDVPFNRKVDPKRALIWINHNPTSLRTLWSSMLASRTSINYRVVRGSRERSTSRKQLTTNKKKFFRSGT